MDREHSAEFKPGDYLAPRHWPVWGLIGLQRIVALLPLAVQRGLGRAIGAAAYRFASRRRRIAATNLAMCLPALSAAERASLLRAHFRALGIGIMEIGFAWWASDRRFRKRYTLEGRHHLEAAQAAGRGVLLLSGHFTTLDIMGRVLSQEFDLDGVHRTLGIPLLDAITHRRRGRFAGRMIQKDEPRALLERIRAGRTVWLASDQADTTAGGVMAPFFGHPAPTNTTVSRLAARRGCAVVPVSCKRGPGGHYHLIVEPAEAPFDDADAAANAGRLNAIVERHARAAPDQYYWIHRRFKTTPSPYDQP